MPPGVINQRLDDWFELGQRTKTNEI